MTEAAPEPHAGWNGSRIPENDTPLPSVLFLCTHNAARSPMAEGYLRARYGHLFHAASAGTELRQVYPQAVSVMGEIGIDISGHRPRLLDEFFGERIDIVVTVCDSAHQACPFFPGAKSVVHAGFPDPSASCGTADERLREFRRVRDAIIAWIDTVFVPRYGRSPLGGSDAPGNGGEGDLPSLKNPPVTMMGRQKSGLVTETDSLQECRHLIHVLAEKTGTLYRECRYDRKKSLQIRAIGFALAALTDVVNRLERDRPVSPVQEIYRDPAGQVYRAVRSCDIDRICDK